MIVKITAQWAATPYFEEGERQFEFEWGNNTTPIVGNVIRMYSFIQSSIMPTEKFIYEGEETDVFRFIENEHRWVVQEVELERYGNDLIGHVLVTDNDYFV